MGGPSTKEHVARRLVKSLARQVFGIPEADIAKVFARIDGLSPDQLAIENMAAVRGLYIQYFGEEVNIVMSLSGYLQRQMDWSRRIFGEGRRTGGISEHIKTELKEIEADPTDIKEWVDVIILGLDGYWRAGGTPERIMADLQAKQFKNMRRQWPATPPAQDEPSFHVKDAE